MTITLEEFWANCREELLAFEPSRYSSIWEAIVADPDFGKWDLIGKHNLISCGLCQPGAPHTVLHQQVMDDIKLDTNVTNRLVRKSE